MNALIVGADKSPLFPYIPNDNFLLIDDGPIIDGIDVPARTFDPIEHSFNPLPRGKRAYQKAREFIEVLGAVFPEGESTLTKANAHFQILQALLDRPKGLTSLIADTKDTQAAYQKIQTLLLSPVLERVLTSPPNFSLTGTILARLNRAELGDFDCFVLANLLISQYRGTVIIPDFGFYACGFHSSLIRQDRLTAGINSFDEVAKLRPLLIQIQEKIGRR